MMSVQQLARTPRFWNLLLTAVAIMGLGFIWLTRVPTKPSTVASQTAVDDSALEPAPIVGHPAPDFTLTTLQGDQVQLSALKGQVVLVNFWATWCMPCRSEMPALQSAYQQYQDRGFTVLAVNQRQEATAVMAFMEEYGLSFPALLDTQGSASASYQANVLPSSFFVDRNGIVQTVYRGPIPASIISGIVEQLLGEA